MVGDLGHGSYRLGRRFHAAQTSGQQKEYAARGERRASVGAEGRGQTTVSQCGNAERSFNGRRREGPAQMLKPTETSFGEPIGTDPPKASMETQKCRENAGTGKRVAHNAGDLSLNYWWKKRAYCAARAHSGDTTVSKASMIQ